MTHEEIAELEAAHAKCPISFNVFRKDEILKNHIKKHEHLEIRTTAVKMPQEKSMFDLKCSNKYPKT